MPFSLIHHLRSPWHSWAVLLASCLLISLRAVLGVSGGGGGRGRQVIMHPLLLAGAQSGGGCTACAHPFPSSRLKAAGSETGERKGSAPSSSHRQCSCPCARHWLASCCTQSRLPDAVCPLRTAWSQCDCRQLHRNAGKAAEFSLSCCHHKGVRVGKEAVVAPAQSQKSPCAFWLAPCSTSSARGWKV